MSQAGAEELNVPEPDEDALEAPTIDHIWTIKVRIFASSPP
jgi:hypothetical protein